MSLLESLVKQGHKFKFLLERDNKPSFILQKRQLLKLIIQAKNTAFGRHYQFDKLIKSIKKSDKNNREFYKEFVQTIPIFDYTKIYEEWWYRDHQNGESDICWKGKVGHYALSSGTSGGPTKYIPVTKEMMRSMRRTSLLQFLSVPSFTDVPSSAFSKGILMLTGSTDLQRKATHYEGDLSGINAGKIPSWFQHYYKPGAKISAEKDWTKKLEIITENAKSWDIGYIAGNPAWLQLLMEKIIERYNVKNIHDIWPNLAAFAYGGVAFEPYKRSFSKLLGHPITYIETYLASEGFLAFQKLPNHNMALVLNVGIFFEFIPFNDKNFDNNGEIIGNPTTYLIDEVEEGVTYAILITTCAGAWRYLIGDTIQFTNKKLYEIIITGRTKHFLSLCGEHLSVDNMDMAVEKVADEMNISVREFCVAGVPHQDGLFAHQWYVGTTDTFDEEKLRTRLDEVLGELNADYKTERTAALKDIYVKILSPDVFYSWMAKKGKMGGQNKFPRVLKKDTLEDWKKHLEEVL